MMKLITALCLIILLSAGFSSCTFEREETDCVAYIKKNMMEPFSDFRVENNAVQLIGNRNTKIPAGEVAVTLWGKSRFGYSVISYWRRIQQGEFKPQFDFSEVDLIELATLGRMYSKGEDSLRIVYDQILQDFKREKYSCSIYYDLPAWSFTKLQHPETQIGFTRHISQHIGNRPMLLKYPFIRINEFVFTDIRKKGILKEGDTIYVNCGGRGYNYRTLSEFDVKKLKKSY